MPYSIGFAILAIVLFALLFAGDRKHWFRPGWLEAAARVAPIVSMMLAFLTFVRPLTAPPPALPNAFSLPSSSRAEPAQGPSPTPTMVLAFNNLPGMPTIPSAAIVPAPSATPSNTPAPATPSPTQPPPPSKTPTETKTAEPAQLTYGVGDNVQASFSYDGKKIVFVSSRDGSPEVYIMNADGSEQKRLTTNPAIVKDYPSFSPDGSRIIFSGNDGKGEQLYLMNSDGSQTRSLTTSDNGTNGRPRLYRGTFTSLNVIFDSSRTGNFEIYWANLTVNGLEAVTRVTNRPDYGNRLPSFVPSKRIVVFRSSSGALTNTHIYTVGLDGSNVKKLSEYNDWYPTVTSDGEWIVFVSDRDGQVDLYRMDTDGGQVARLTNDPEIQDSPAVSPDGQWLVYAARRDQTNYHLYRRRFVPLPR